MLLFAPGCESVTIRFERLSSFVYRLHLICMETRPLCVQVRPSWSLSGSRVSLRLVLGHIFLWTTRPVTWAAAAGPALPSRGSSSASRSEVTPGDRSHTGHGWSWLAEPAVGHTGEAGPAAESEGVADGHMVSPGEVETSICMFLDVTVFWRSAGELFLSSAWGVKLFPIMPSLCDVLRRYRQVPQTEADGAFNYNRASNRRGFLNAGRSINLQAMHKFHWHPGRSASGRASLSHLNQMIKSWRSRFMCSRPHLKVSPFDSPELKLQMKIRYFTSTEML